MGEQLYFFVSSDFGFSSPQVIFVEQRTNRKTSLLALQIALQNLLLNLFLGLAVYLTNGSYNLLDLCAEHTICLLSFCNLQFPY